ncbi:hypothetical protein CRYUN_Cryun11dG0145600 [Craigia yunnanensis]
MKDRHPKKKRRTPTWCDRILWYGRGLYQISYVRGESKFSDHRPVYSVFSLEVESINRSRIRKNMRCPNARIERHKVVEKEAETQKKKAISEAEKTAIVSKILMEQKLVEKESARRQQEIENQIVMKEAEANKLKLTPEFLELKFIEAIADNTKIFFGEKGIKQFFVAVERDEWKFDTFCDLYDTLTITQAVVFCNTERKMESGLIATGASIWVQGTLVASQGSKQKVELKVDKVVVGLTKTGNDYEVKAARVELAERMRKFLITPIMAACLPTIYYNVALDDEVFKRVMQVKKRSNSCSR